VIAIEITDCGPSTATVVHQDLNLDDASRARSCRIVGGSGSGKTTLLRQMLGLERPARGCVRVFGVDISEPTPTTLQQLRNRWGMLFQQGALFSALTVFDNIAQPMRELRALPEDLIRDAVLLKLQMVGLGPEHAQDAVRPVGRHGQARGAGAGAGAGTGTAVSRRTDRRPRSRAVRSLRRR
jgi:ABC-type transporter Mla maintaining outer membrane lipid asymmetry ATPase subunit MlaF